MDVFGAMIMLRALSLAPVSATGKNLFTFRWISIFIVLT